jgi:hypothetical protein
MAVITGFRDEVNAKVDAVVHGDRPIIVLTAAILSSPNNVP